MSQRLVADLFVALALVAACASPAAAGDRRASPQTPQPAAPATFDWSGVYIGANVGFGTASGTADRNIGGTVISGAADIGGIIGGGQVGYNWQTGNIVLGVEADLQASGMLHDWSATDGATTADGTDKLSWFSTVRGRVGYAFDNYLVYATAGGAFATFDVSSTITPPSGVSVPVSWTQERLGWTAGIGTEVGFGDNWSGRLEYLFIDAGTFSGVDALSTAPMRVQLTDHILRVGVNYRFH
jgi:outer membrane immunogenic protein